MNKKNKPAVSLEVKTLRDQITAIGGRPPKSDDPRYLRARLDQLKARKKDGSLVKRGSNATTIGISVPTEMASALDRICEKVNIGRSELAQRAFVSWAKANGHASEAAAMENK